MNDYKYLKEIENISPKNSFVNYIIDRVISNDYRGFQCSQHNRLTFDYFSCVLQSIYDIAKEDSFDLHVGDFKNILQPAAYTYYKIVDKICLSSGRGTVNSVKKNTFPDIARMGFLTRYDRNGNKLDEGERSGGVYSASLSGLGVKFINSTTFEKIKLFTDGVDRLTKNTASELVELLYLNDNGINSIDILEYMYILSDDRENISTNDKLRLLLDYRNLSHNEKTKITSLLEQFCNPKNRKEYNNKTLLRDYHNWKNESQQIFCLLSNSTYFKVENNKLILNTGNYGIFDEQTKRGQKAKVEYFAKHGVNKKSGFELHHIIPFSRALNKNDALYIDDYKNLIYLNSKKHSEFTANGSKNVILSYTQNNPNILFLNFDHSFIMIDITKDALFSEKLLPSIKEYNEALLKRFY